MAPDTEMIAEQDALGTALAIAGEALTAWGAMMRPPRLVKIRENIVLDIEIEGRGRAALRLHRPGYQSAGAIAGELGWTDALRRAGLPVPPPLRTVGGDWTALASDGRIVSAVGWLEARPFGTGDQPLGADAPAKMRRLGRLIAAFHNATDAGARPAKGDREHWLDEALLGDTPRWGRFWEHPDFTPGERAELLAARDEARLRLAGLHGAGADTGPIHADLLRENVLEGPEGLCLIDFDDSGEGFRLYDLATALIQSCEDADRDAQTEALVAGYRSARALPDTDEGNLPLFIALRGFASAGWVLSRLPADSPTSRKYARRALMLSRRAGLALPPGSGDGDGA